MKKVCYFCTKCIDCGAGDNDGEVLHTVCDECYSRLRLDERLPELLWAVAALRKQNGSNKEYQQTLVVLPAS